MEFSLVDGMRREPKPGLRGLCDVCGGEMVSKCGNIRIRHWAHLHKVKCDSWWENETPWHREWKSRFPEAFREIVISSVDGVKHRADVRTDYGLVIEFQHSSISIAERRAREAFYKNMIWVIDGTRLKKDVDRFNAALRESYVLENSPLKFEIAKRKCTIIKAWADADVDVFLDFGERRYRDHQFYSNDPILWKILPCSAENRAELLPVPREVFVSSVLEGVPPDGIDAPHIQITPQSDGEPEMPFKPSGKPLPPLKRKLASESDTDFAKRMWGIE